MTTEATTQLFFADSISAAAYAANSYSRGGTRDTTNSAATSGYAGTVSIGILEGTIYGG